VNRKERQLLAHVPDVMNYKSLLYIGASACRQETLGLFIKRGYDYTILEIWRPNVEWLRKRFKNVIEGDVRDINGFNLGNFDIICWWHGPEHLKEDELVPMLDKLENMTKKILITACPWGIYEQGAAEGNPHEIHYSYLYPEFFEKLGWKTSAMGRVDVKGSNLLAWKTK